MAKRNPCNAANLEVGTPWEGCQQHGGHARCRSLGWSSYKVGVARTWGVQSLLQLWEVELDCLVCCCDQQISNRWPIWINDEVFFLSVCFHICVVICPSVFRILYRVFLFLMCIYSRTLPNVLLSRYILSIFVGEYSPSVSCSTT